jgi:sn1-specific diacylglycerol lipase
MPYFCGPLLALVSVMSSYFFFNLINATYFGFQDGVDETYDLVLVGHSLGAGTAAILAILLRQEFPNLHCYAFSPPGGLLR